VEGSELVNGAAQKRAGEMAAEALIALTLSRLREATRAGTYSDPSQANPCRQLQSEVMHMQLLAFDLCQCFVHLNA
jgi:hypothetical protein